MKPALLCPALIVSLMLISLNCKKGGDDAATGGAPWEKAAAVKESVKDAPETVQQGFFLALADVPKFYDKPGGRELNASNIKSGGNPCISYDFLPRKNEAAPVEASMIREHQKYFRLHFSPDEPCGFDVWVSGAEGAFLSAAQFTDYTKTKTGLEPAVVEALASSKFEGLNFMDVRKTLIGSKPSAPSFYLVSMISGFIPGRLKERIMPWGNGTRNFQFVLMEKGGSWSLVSQNFNVSYLDRSLPGGTGSIKHADVDADGAPEIITFSPSVGTTPSSELYGFVNGAYAVIDKCHEGANCFFRFEGGSIIKESQETSEELQAAGKDPWVTKTVRYSYRAGKLTPVQDQKQPAH